MLRKALSVVLSATLLSVVAMMLGCAPNPAATKPTPDQLKEKRDLAQGSYSIGHDYFVKNDYQSALRNFLESVGDDSTFYDAYIAVGATYRKLRDPEQSKEYYRLAMKLEPKKGEAYVGLGDLFEAMDSPDSALEVYSDGIRQDSTLVDLYFSAAQVYMKKSLLPLAESLHTILSRHFPDDQNIQWSWADLLFKQKLYQEAVDAMVPVLARFPKAAPIRLRLADSYAKLRKFPEAIAELDTILQNDSTDYSTLLRKGALLLQSDKVKPALAIFQSLAERDSTKADYFAYWGEALMQQGNAVLAEAKLNKALALEPGMPRAYVDLGNARVKSADVKRGASLAKATAADLRAARALYEEAKGYFGKAVDDALLGDYSQSRIEYIDQTVAQIDKELSGR